MGYHTDVHVRFAGAAQSLLVHLLPAGRGGRGSPVPPKYTESEFTRYQALLYGLVAAYGLVPTAHWTYLQGLDAAVTRVGFCF